MVTISSSGGTSSYAFIYYHNPALEMAAFVVMLLSSFSLLLVWKAWNRRRLLMLLRDTEIQIFLLAVLGVVLMNRKRGRGTGI